MDGERFDAVARRLVGIRSRRAVVVAALGGVLGAVGLAGAGGGGTTRAVARDNSVLAGAAFRDETGAPVPGGCVVFAAGARTAVRACDQEPGDAAPHPGDVGVRLAAGEYDFLFLAPPGYRLLQSSGGTFEIDAGAPDGLGVMEAPVARVGAAEATFVVRAAWCPAGDPAAYARCRGNAQVGVTFAADGQAMVTDWSGVATLAVPSGSLNVALDPAVVAASSATYVTCVDGSTGAVVLATDEPPPTEPIGGIGLNLAAGQTVVCDWYNLTAAGAGVASPVASPAVS